MWALALLLPASAVADCSLSASTCYVDDVKRILNAWHYQGGLSREYCAQICSDKGFAIAGVENGDECYCGNALRADANVTSAGDCHVTCEYGPAGEKCGGIWRLDVYNFTCAGKPVPQPRGPDYINNPCLDKTSAYASQPWCDPTLSIDERVTDMVKRLTLKEKIAALNTQTTPLPSLGLNGYNWWSEATHGISHVRNDAKTPYETNFAFPITTGMSFNRTLWTVTGRQIGREARAFMNVGNAWSTYWAPVVNLAREPRWGRNIETPGEDPYLSGEYATAFVTGFQKAPEDPGHLMASACCKHYVANSMEHSTVAGETWTRHTIDATITQQDLVDSYMLPFQACVEKGQVSSLMCSYNAVNGKPSCANDWLLKTVARDAWGFDGYITSDCGAVSDVYHNHHFTATPEETVQAVLAAGTDVDCTNFVAQYGQSAFDKKLISEDDIDARLRMLFRVRMRLAHFDPPGPLQQIPPSDVCSAAAIALAEDGVTQGASLYKNDGKALPLEKARLKTLAVLGPNANLGHQISTYYGGNNCAGTYNSLKTSLEAALPAGTVVYEPGVPSVLSNDTSGVAAAAKAARAADETLLVLGTDLTWSHEEHDAVGAAEAISLSPGQMALLAAVAGNASKPIIVITLTATPLDLTPVLSNPKVGAVLHLGQPSVQTNGALPILFGERSPAGRAIQTVYPAEYGDMISIFDFNMRPGAPTSAAARPRPHHTAPHGIRVTSSLTAGRSHALPRASAASAHLPCLVVPHGGARRPVGVAAPRLQGPAGRVPARHQPRPHISLLHGFARHPVWVRSLVHHLHVHARPRAVEPLARAARAAAARHHGAHGRLALSSDERCRRERRLVRRQRDQHGRHGCG